MLQYISWPEFGLSNKNIHHYNHPFCTEPLYSTQLDLDYNKGINSTSILLFVPENIAKNYWVTDISLHVCSQNVKKTS